MASKSIPVYRDGRKFYVSPEEYQLIRSDDRRQRRRAAQKLQNLPVTRSPRPTNPHSSSVSLYDSLPRASATPHDPRYHSDKILLPTTPTTILEPSRPSRSILKHRGETATLNSHVAKKHASLNPRSSSSEPTANLQRISLASDPSNSDDTLIHEGVQRSLSFERTPSPSASPLRNQPFIVSTRRTVPDYGIAPISTFSMMPAEQTASQSNASNATHHFIQMRPSTLNPAIASGHGSLTETAVQGNKHAYTVFGSSNRPAPVRRSVLTDRNHDYHPHSTASGTLSNDSSLSRLTLFQRQSIDMGRSRQPAYSAHTNDDEDDDADENEQQRDLWTYSVGRSQSTDASAEKKRVRFADMEGQTLESMSDKDTRTSPRPNRLFTRGTLQNPTYSATSRVHVLRTRRKLATDV